tara:strand:- start:766 stop:1002 length:237 start_codon:yes stop_codon:yes gene_type:complete
MKKRENTMKQLKVNDIRFKALTWWRGLSKDMKITMIHNPSVNKTGNLNFELTSRSSIKVQKMFENWLNWKLNITEIKE